MGVSVKENKKAGKEKYQRHNTEKCEDQGTQDFPIGDILLNAQQNKTKQKLSCQSTSL